MTYKTWVFDCDGVLLASNAAKSRAIYLAAERYGRRKANELVAFHKTAGSASRRERFEHYLTNIVNQPGDLDAMLDDCGALLRNVLLSCEKVAGVERYLATLTGRKVVVSGVDAAELRWLLGQHDLLTQFDACWGGPGRKSELLPALVESGEIQLPAVYFGDTQDDYESATAAGLEFIFVSAHSDWMGWREYFADKRVRIIGNFVELL